LETAARECAALLQLVDVDLRRLALMQQMARHLAVPEQKLARMLQAAPRRSAAAQSSSAASGAASGAASSAAAGAAGAETPAAPVKRTAAAAAEHDLLACALAQPSLLDPAASAADVASAPFEEPAIAELFGMVRDALAVGRSNSAEVVRYLFTRC